MLCAGPRSRCWEYSNKQTVRDLYPSILMGETEKSVNKSSEIPLPLHPLPTLRVIAGANEDSIFMLPKDTRCFNWI